MVQVVPCNTVRNRGELATSCRPGIQPTILMAARSIAEGSAEGPPGFASKSTESINQISLIQLFGIPKLLGFNRRRRAESAPNKSLRSESTTFRELPDDQHFSGSLLVNRCDASRDVRSNCNEPLLYGNRTESVPGKPAMAIQDMVNGPNFSGQSRAFGNIALNSVALSKRTSVTSCFARTGSGQGPRQPQRKRRIRAMRCANG